MKFIYLAVSCCTLWTLISALPLFGSEITPRGSDQRVERRSLYARTTPSEPRRSKRLAGESSSTASGSGSGAAAAPAPPPDVPHALSLKRTKIGTEDEHWAMQFHPTTDGAGNLHVLDAASDKRRKGVLRVESKDKGTYTKPPAKEGSETHHIANFPNEAAAMAALSSAKNNVKLTEKFPNDNCVDFTKAAAEHMAATGHISATDAAKVTALHTAHAATVKEKTDTEKNRKAAGGT